jgi:hypothetical protein
MQKVASTDELTVFISDEVLRERVREILQDEKQAPSKIGKFFAHPLTAVVVGFLLTGVIGLALSWYFNESAKERDRDYATYEASIKAVQDFSRAVYARYTRAEMLLSALRRGAPLEEVQEKKKLYDGAFVDWGINLQANLLTIRRLTKSVRFTSFEATVESEFTPLLTTLDQCLTKAYDERAQNGNPALTIEHCKADAMLKNILSKGYDITNSLYEYVAEEMQESEALNSADRADGKRRRRSSA